MVKKSHGKSKRTSMKDKYKIQRKVKEHHRKARRHARRQMKAGGFTGMRKKSDPGIPNLFPFKAQLLRQMEAQKERMEARKRAAQEKRRLERQRRKQLGMSGDGDLEAMVDAASQKGSQFAEDNDSDNEEQIDELQRQASSNSATSNSRAYYRELNKVLDAADILLEILDVRDPMGCRSKAVEAKFLGSAREEKRVIIVLTKVDLVPTDVTMQWLRYFRREHPCIAFKSAAQKAGAGRNQRLGHASGGVTGTTGERLVTDTSLCVGGDALLQLLKNYSRTYNMKKAITVGVVGYPNVGKSSLVNSLKRSRAVGVSSTPGHTKVLQEVQLDSKVKLIDSPGVIFDEARDTDGKVTAESLLLRNCISADSMTDPVPAATAIVSRCRVEQLMELYSVAQYRSADEFLWLLAKTQGKLLKGGVPDRARAARILVRDWNTGKVPFYTLPPATEKKADATILARYSAEFQLEEVFAANDSAVVAGGPQTAHEADDFVVLPSAQTEGDGVAPMSWD